MNPQSHITHAKRVNSTSAGTQESLAQQDKHKWQLDYLNLEGILTLEEPSCNDFCIRVKAEQIWKQKCPNCGCESKDVRPNGTRRQIILDEPRGLRSVKIELRRRSYKCKECEKAGLLPLDCLVEKRGITRRLLDYLENESLLRPFSELAQEVGLSTRTVRDIFNARVAVCDGRAAVTAPRVMGIDGVYVERKERAILTDIEHGAIIDIWDSASAKTLIPALRDLPGRKKIEVVVMDMSKSLRRSVKQALPHAVIVIDRYHIQRMANEALDKVRKRLRPSVRHKNQLTMCKSSLLRKHPHKLKEDEKIEVEGWFNIESELRKAYELKEKFFAIWHTSCRATAQENYRQWRLSIRPELCKDFKNLIKAMSYWGEYVFNYFDHPYTNAFTESTNRRIKDIQREARNGKFKTIRGKTIYGTIVRREMKAARERQAKPKRSRAKKAGVAVMKMPPPLIQPLLFQMPLF